MELTLQRTKIHTETTVQDVDVPSGRTGWLLAEISALIGQIALSTTEVVFDQTHGQKLGDYAEAATWTYVLLLAGIRTWSASTPRLAGLKIWLHMALLYAAQWVFIAIRFRSVLVHAENHSRVTRITTIVEFALSTLLLTVALLSRKGNKVVVLEHEHTLVASREPLASPLSLALFGWVDPIVWKGYQKTLELADVWDLRASDKTAQILAQFRQIKKTHSFAFRLLLYFRRYLLLQGVWSLFSNLFTFLPTLLLKGILEHLEDPVTTPASAAWLYVILLLISGVLKSVGDNQALWIGRRVCIQLRGIIIGEIYSKLLRRQATAAPKDEDEKTETSQKEMSRWLRLKRRFLGDQYKAVPKISVDDAKKDTRAKDGTIINLMSIDSFKVSEISSYLHYLWANVPVQLVLATTLVYRILGKSSLAGIAIMLVVLPLNLFIAKSFQRAQKRIMAATDSRIHSTNEVLQNIRIIKYFAWELRFSSQVNDKRRSELGALRKKYILWSCAAMVWSGVPILTTFASFFVYTVIEKKQLVPSIAFPALSMFALLRVPLDQLADMIAHVQESKVSVDRVEDFLREAETEKYYQLRDSRLKNGDSPKIALENATLSWGSGNLVGGKMACTNDFRLIKMSVEFEIGRLNLIVGPTGSGKSSLLLALLGEMKLVKGQVYIPGGQSRQNLRRDPDTGLTEGVAYCAQQAWLVNATIRENIIFASPFDQRRYEKVIYAAALQRDLEIFDAGDRTMVGEKGISLSGGQKQRICLARALYSTARHVLLDDCLSAVDSHTARHIFEKGIDGELMLNRTCILVTHNISLTIPSASFVVALDNGKIAGQGTPDDVIDTGVLGEEMIRSKPGSRGNSGAPSRVASNLEQLASKLSEMGTLPNPELSGLDSAGLHRPASRAQHEQTTFTAAATETKATGSVKAATVKMYLQSMGSWTFWIFAVFAFAATQVGSVATNLWIRQWANSYHTSRSSTSFFMTNGLQVPVAWPEADSRMATSRLSLFTVSRSDVDVTYFLSVYAIIGLLYVFICFFRELLLFAGSLHASWALHEKLLHSVMRAKFRFFDSTPLGQLMNRFSKDIEAIDQEVSPVAMGMFNSLASVITIVILISAITPGFLIAGVFISAIYIAVGTFYIRSSRDLKRIESVERSPLFQAFGETLSGIVTIRAYGDEARFIQDTFRRVNTSNRPFIYLWATNRWLSVRTDLAGALVAFSAGLFVMRSSRFIDPGAAGLSLSYAITFTDTILWLVRLYGANEQNMNSVERIKEYLDVEQEAAAHVPETQPSSNWPSRGMVQFVDYSTRYRPDLAPVLKRVSFEVKAGERVGIVGRTGAGKSSLALALLRGLEAETGSIIIDDIDIGQIGLEDLRKAITIVPQDPTLFTGTLRSNLDPFGRFTDEQISSALRKVQLIANLSSYAKTSQSSAPTSYSAAATLTLTAAAMDGPKLGSGVDTMASDLSDATLLNSPSNVRENTNIFTNVYSPVSESGSNLSQGQRQLLCLARALLKMPRVLLMDEATASIDYATDARIQSVLRELKDTTIITIAHRLHTIIDYDKVLVLDHGRVIEYGDPWDLLREHGSTQNGQSQNAQPSDRDESQASTNKPANGLREMCVASGEFETLYEAARKAWNERQKRDPAAPAESAESSSGEQAQATAQGTQDEV